MTRAWHSSGGAAWALWPVLAMGAVFAGAAPVAVAGDGDGGAMVAVYDALHDIQNWLLVGVALLLGRFGGRLTSRIGAPMVVGYLLVGIVLGRSVLNVVSAEATDALELVTDFGLGIVAFMIGTELSRRLIRRLGAKLLIIMVSESLVAFAFVALLVWSLSGWLLPAGLAVAGALIFGAMAPASAPAGTVAVIQEYGARGPLTRLLLGIVGLDDAFAIMIYAFAAAAAKVLLSAGTPTFVSLVQGPVLEIVGGLAVGAVVGVQLRVILARRGDHGDALIYTLGAILLTTGLANALGLSLILANLGVGAVLANLSRRKTEHAYQAIQGITGPVFVLFFVVAGAHLDLRLLAALSLLGPVYIVGRSAGLIGGAYLGATLSRAEPTVRRYLGLGILSQAGVAIGLALTVANEFRDPLYGELGRQLAELTINTIAATTIIFEVVGPLTTKLALSRAGEIAAAAPAGRQAGATQGETA
ncbi:MAG: cation:proton antiporter [Phycisphaerae bacterium]|nr:cation:proton antiporter [Phycisphaerae bacterium]